MTKKGYPILLSIFIFFIFASCATTTRNIGFVDADREVTERNYLSAVEQLNTTGKENPYRDKDQVLKYLDTGILYHMAEKHKESIESFNEAERLIQENFTKSITDAGTSFLLNDYTLEYFGESYEDLYLNIFKAIDFIRLDNFDSAFVEIRRLTDKLNLLEDKYGNMAHSMNSSKDAQGTIKAGKTEFHNSALARYFGILLYRADNRRDSAAIDLAKLKEAFRNQPNVYNFPPPKNLDKMLEGTNKARINVVAFTGRSPIKKASSLRITTLENLILITQEKEDDQGRMILTDLTPIPFFGVTGGYNFKTQTPEMVRRPSRISKIQVSVNGVPSGGLELIEKLDEVAIETFNLRKGMIFFKTVIRTVTKGILTKQTTKAANNAAANAGGVVQVLSFLGGIALTAAVDSSEQADLRSARYFPGQAYVGEFWVEPGEHIITVDYYNKSNILLYRKVFAPGNYVPGKLYILPSYDLQ
ncbi:MAG: hypothetical protein FWE72_07820 [Spirochaetaceae bacterium]|nr:hypothetical protein [Spirochaetaceae bacterium]